MREAIAALTSCGVIFGCVDHDGPRLVLTELGAAYRVALIDAATEDLDALALTGQLDDYTYNLDPAPTSGDDLSAVLGPTGDLR